MNTKKELETYDKIRYGNCEYVRFRYKRGSDNYVYICKILLRHFVKGDNNNGYLKIYVIDSNTGLSCYKDFECFFQWRTRSYWHPDIINDKSELMAMIL